MPLTGHLKTLAGERDSHHRQNICIQAIFLIRWLIFTRILTLNTYYHPAIQNEAQGFKGIEWGATLPPYPFKSIPARPHRTPPKSKLGPSGAGYTLICTDDFHSQWPWALPFLISVAVVAFVFHRFSKVSKYFLSSLAGIRLEFVHLRRQAGTGLWSRTLL